MRSGFYAGRKPSTGDLNSQILEMFYLGMKRDLGGEAASNFVRFVNNLDDLSASAFIVAFEQFWASGCEDVGVRQEPGDRNRLSGRGHGLEVEAFGLIGETLFGRPMSEEEIRVASVPIKSSFIRAHESEVPKDERRSSVRESPWGRREFGYARELGRF
jgi:hypothetical protein